MSGSVNGFNINNFRSQLIYDGARPNLFQVFMTFPPNVLNSTPSAQKLTFMCKAASIPSRNLGIAPVFYFGREIKYPGNVTFDDWAITIINDEDFVVRNAFENWGNLLNSHVGNLRDPSFINDNGYAADGSVLQFGKTGNTLAEYDFAGMFPTTQSAIDLDWGNVNTIEEFTVTMAVQLWTNSKTTDS